MRFLFRIVMSLGATITLACRAHAADTIISLADSARFCVVSSESVRGKLARSKGGVIKPLKKGAQNRELVKLRKRFKGIQARGKKADRARVGARGKPSYA